jgi:hypothetical protein
MVRRIAIALLVIGVVVAGYGFVTMARFRSRAVQASASSTDAMQRLQDERIQRMMNDVRAVQRGESERWVWAGLAIIAAGVVMLKVTAKREPPPTDLFQH